MVDVRNRVTATGFTEAQLMDCIHEVRVLISPYLDNILIKVYLLV